MNQEVKINPIMQPLQAKQFRIIGHLLDSSQFNVLRKRMPWWKGFIYSFGENISAWVGLTLFAIIFIVALIFPLFTADPRDTDLGNKYLGFFQDGHFFGTDSQGRDMWAFTMHGLRFSLLLGFFVAIVNFTIGTLVGIAMGHFPLVDKILLFVMKIITNVPGILIMILATMIFKPTFWTIAMSLVMTGWVGIALLARAQILRVKHSNWVTASRLLGTPKWKVLLNYFPVILPVAITQIVFMVPGAMVSEMGLAFIGLSIPNQPSLGAVVSMGSQLVTIYPRYLLIPAVLLFQITLSIQLVGVGIEKALIKRR